MAQKESMEDASTLGVLLRKPSEVLVQQVYARLKESGFEGIRPTHGPVLRHILPTGSRATDLAAKAQMTKQSMAYLLEDLTSLGYLEQSPDPTDGRARLVRLTQRGIEVQRAAKRVSREIEKAWAKEFGVEAWAEFRAQLVRLNEIVGE